MKIHAKTRKKMLPHIVNCYECKILCGMSLCCLASWYVDFLYSESLWAIIWNRSIPPPPPFNPPPPPEKYNGQNMILCHNRLLIKKTPIWRDGITDIFLLTMIAISSILFLSRYLLKPINRCATLLYNVAPCASSDDPSANRSYNYVKALKVTL